MFHISSALKKRKKKELLDGSSPNRDDVVYFLFPLYLSFSPFLFFFSFFSSLHLFIPSPKKGGMIVNTDLGQHLYNVLKTEK